MVVWSVCLMSLWSIVHDEGEHKINFMRWLRAKEHCYLRDFSLIKSVILLSFSFYLQELKVKVCEVHLNDS